MKELELLPWGIIASKATEYGLQANWIAAVIMTESGGNKYSARYEPHFKYLYHPRTYAEKLGITVETEEVMQKTSIGLMQMMGAVARESGFSGHLPELYNIERNIKYGCIALKKHYQKYGNIIDGVAAYNAGSVRKTKGGLYVNEKHVDRFGGWLRKIESASGSGL